MQRDIGGQGFRETPDQRRRVKQIALFRIKRGLIIACADAILQRVAIPDFMRQARRLHRCFQSPHLLCPEIGGRRLDAARALQPTINAVFFDGRHQPSPAFFGEAIKRFGMLKESGAGTGGQVTRAGEA